MFGLPEFLIFGGLFFWLFVGFAGFLLMLSVHREQPLGIFWVLLLGAIVLQVFSDFKPFTWMADHPKYTLIGVGAYIAVGVIWTFVRWFLFTLKASELYAEKRKEFIKRECQGTFKPEHKEALNTYINRSQFIYRFGGTMPPQPGRNKHRIFIWLIMWPLDGLWTLINDPVIRLFNFIYGIIAKALEGISAKRFKNFEEFK